MRSPAAPCGGRARVGGSAAEASALLIALVVAFPLYWMVLSALKPAGEIQSGDAAAVDPGTRRWTPSGRVLGVQRLRPVLPQQPDRRALVVVVSPR